MINPGELNSRIVIQKKKGSTGPALNLDDYEDYKPLWGKVHFLTGKNLYTARAGNVKTEVDFIIRYRRDLDETMRVKYNNEYYEIEGILPLDNTKSYLVIKAHNIKHDM